MKAGDDLRQKKLNESSTNPSFMNKQSTWDRMTKPVAKVNTNNVPTQNTNVKSTYQAPATSSKKGLIESIFGVKKNPTVESSQSTTQTSINVENSNETSQIATNDSNEIPMTSKPENTIDTQKEILSTNEMVLSKTSTQQQQPQQSPLREIVASKEEECKEYQIEDR